MPASPTLAMPGPVTTPPAAPLTAPEQRSAEILASVRQAFSEKGFDGASMQDLARASGMSVGNFYRYFPSKAAIVEALISSDLAETEALFRAILDSPRPMQALRATLVWRIEQQEKSSDGQLWSEISAVSRRKPEIAVVAKRMETHITGYLTRIFAAETRLPLEEAQARFTSHAHFLILLIKSVSCFCGGAQNAEDRPGHQEALNQMVLRTIDTTLAEISAAAVSADPHI
jgi:AcrR family transcriptional regulator